MRRMNLHTQPGQHDDRGVATILVVLMMPVLVLAGAFVFDGGRGVLARRQTQNAADSAALAKAQDCAVGITTTDFTAYETNGAVLANSPTCGSGVTTVTMSRTITYLFRPDLKGGTTDVQRTAIARWGVLSSAITAPVVISQCTFDLSTNFGTTFPSEEVVIPLGAGGEECPGRPPGSFGWLDANPAPNQCSITTTLNGSGQHVAHGNTGTGNVNPWGCLTQIGVNGLLTIPIFGAACRAASPCVMGQNDGVGDNTYFLIIGFAELQITGWNLQHGSPKTAGNVPTEDPCTGSTSCLRGRFVRFATQQGSSGSGTNFGVVQIYLSLT